MLGLDFSSSPNANESPWVGYRDLPPQSRSLLVCEVSLRLSRITSLLVNAVPLEPSLLDRCGLRLVARLLTQQFPDKTAQLPRDGHDRLVALESPRQKTPVAIALAGAGSVPCSLWAARRNAGHIPPITTGREHCRIW